MLYVRRVVNAKVDALAALAASLSVPDGEICHITISRRRLLTPLNRQNYYRKKSTTTYGRRTHKGLEDPILEFLEQGRHSNSLAKRLEIKRRATTFVLLKNMLYQRSLDGILLWCITYHEIHEAMSEVQYGLFRAHQLGPKFYMQLKGLGYYWLTINLT